MELGNKSLGELRQLQEDIKAELKRREQEDIARARQQIMAIAESVGIPLQELISKKSLKAGAGAGAKVAVRFRNPDDESKKWTGRGREPKWVKEWRESGKSLDLLRV